MKPATTLLAAALVSIAGGTGAQIDLPSLDAPARRPEAVVDLATTEGARLVRGTWRYSDARIVEVAHRTPGADLRASGPPNRTWDLAPKAGGADFDDAEWTVIAPEALEARRGSGRLCFGWYRARITIPERVGRLDPTGMTVVFEIVVDDYAEVWVNGRLPAALGQVGGPCIKGFNAPNRVVLTRDARPGQTFQLAVLAMNGPVSDPPANFLWVRSATLDFHRAGTVGAIAEFPVTVTGRSAGLDAVLPPEARIERVATGFTFTEGPVWHPDGYLLFSDPNENVIYRWSPDGQVTVWRAKSGYAGVDLGEYRQSGSNGLALDPEGRLAICQHGNRRVIRLERTGAVTVLADRHEGKRLNSPNDLVFRSDGALFFTDPCFGLPGLEQDPRRELPVAGVFSLRDGTLRLVASELKGPNGIALSPDERRLYVGNWDERAKVVRRYDVAPDATLSKGEVFCDLTGAAGEDAIDGIKVDRTGNVYVSGPGGLWVLSPSGERLGTIVFPEHPHNLAWGDADGRTLYVAAQRSIYRVRLRVSGARVGAGER